MNTAWSRHVNGVLYRHKMSGRLWHGYRM